MGVITVRPLKEGRDDLEANDRLSTRDAKDASERSVVVITGRYQRLTGSSPGARTPSNRPCVRQSLLNDRTLPHEKHVGSAHHLCRKKPLHAGSYGRHGHGIRPTYGAVGEHEGRPSVERLMWRVCRRRSGHIAQGLPETGQHQSSRVRFGGSSRRDGCSYRECIADPNRRGIGEVPEPQES